MQKNTEILIYRTLIAIIIIILILFVLLKTDRENITHNQQASDESTSIMQIKAIPIRQEEKVLEYNYIGYVVPINHVEVVSFINGFIEDIPVKDGEKVKKGDALIRIKPDEYKAAKKAATAAVMKASAILSNTKSYFERMKNAGEKAVSKTQIDDARASYMEAKANLNAAKADLTKAEVNLEYTKINASIDGTCGYVNLSVGDYISPTKPLFEIIQLDPIRVVFSISDKDFLAEKNVYDAIFSNDKIKLKLADGRIYDQEGFVSFYDNKIDRKTNSIAVYAEFANPQKILLPNSYVDVIIEKKLNNVVMLDKKLLIMRPDGDFVYIIRNGEIELKQTKILGDEDEKYILANNFESGDMLITEVNDNLHEGIKANPITHQTGEN